MIPMSRSIYLFINAAISSPYYGIGYKTVAIIADVLFSLNHIFSALLFSTDPFSGVSWVGDCSYLHFFRAGIKVALA